MILRRSLLAAIAASACLSVLPSAASAQAVMKLANATINDVQHEWKKLFAEALKKRIGDKVKVEIYPASQLGGAPRQTEGLRLGTIEAAIAPVELFGLPSSVRPSPSLSAGSTVAGLQSVSSPSQSSSAPA